MNMCAVVLAAGEGTRLRPLTLRVPKPLCPVGNVRLVDRTLARLAAYGLAGPDQVALNACHLADQIVAAVDGRAHLSVEPPPALGTSGGVGRLRTWIGERAVLACNADVYLDPDGDAQTSLLAGWEGTTVRILVVPAGDDVGEFGESREWRFAGMSLLPPRAVRALQPRTSDLVTTVWRPAEARGALDLVPYQGTYFDCGTPANYLAANLHAAAGGTLIADDAVVNGDAEDSVVGSGAEVHGRLTRAVVLPGGYVDASEHLVDTIRVGRDITMQTRR
ncbi:MAG: NTP transferase domain-containing protein [Micromonosporaceae bacterium]